MTEFKRLSCIESFVKLKFPHFGVNKNQEITRLIYEISKRELVQPNNILKGINSANYNYIKRYLLERRYPFSSLHEKDFKPYLPKIELNSSDCADLEEKSFYPKNVFIEKDASGTHLAKRFKSIFTESNFKEISSLKDYRSRNKNNKIENYNKRRDAVFIVNEYYDFFRKCPCTKNAYSCGYHIFNLGFGCTFECSYCYLQEYTNTPGIILPANINRFFDEYNLYKMEGLRIGTGEFTDSLALDDVTEYSLYLTEFFLNQKGTTFEFKTKSTNIKNILKAKHQDNIVVSWSVNPQNIIDKNEFFCPSLKKRINAMAECVKADYKIGLHFDPVIYNSEWEATYASLIENLFSRVKPESIAWISIGTLRFNPDIKRIIEKRFPENKILDEELILGYDRKLRYPYSVRYKIYKKMIELLFKHSRKLRLYLCMEEPMLLKELKIPIARI